MTNKTKRTNICLTIILFVAFLSNVSLGQNAKKKSTYFSDELNDELINQYIQTKGDTIILFDPSNIKRFWIDNSVLCKKETFDVLLHDTDNHIFESIPLKIQLANVNETQDCRIEIIANSGEVDFSILNNQKEIIPIDSSKGKFIDYNITTSTFHLEDTNESTFYILFHSKTDHICSIKRMILSFSYNQNTTFLFSPGKIVFSKNLVSTSSSITDIDKTRFSVTGKMTVLSSSLKILANKNIISNSVRIKNIGKTQTRIYIGYKVYSKDNLLLNGRNYPFMNHNKILNVVSVSKDNDKIIVDSYPEWSKNCYLALDAKADMSDIPSTAFAETIQKIDHLENGQAEITLNFPSKSPIINGTKVRVHGKSGAYLYMDYKVLQPEEEHYFFSTIQKDETVLEYSPKALSRGVYYVVPIILSYSIDPEQENTILINDYSISY